MTNINVVSLPILSDNYIHLLHNKKTNCVAAVDPGLASPVLSYLDQHDASLTDILITHHHLDHIGGLRDLKEKTNATIYGPQTKKIDSIDIFPDDNDTISPLQQPCLVLTTPGHTLDHLSYYFPTLESLFCGDTLFSFGCGRLFEGTPSQLWSSLKKLRNLPATTKIYSAHEYTVNNLQFAKTLEPNNKRLLKTVTFYQGKKLPTLPTTLDEEIRFNPFLKCDNDTFVKTLTKTTKLDPNLTKHPEKVFAHIRYLKDTF